jgi:hypothetical protein
MDQYRPHEYIDIPDDQYDTPGVDIPLVDSDGKPRYTRAGFIGELYPRDQDGNEFYLKYGDVDLLAKSWGLEYYARKADGDEFYPRRWK